MQTKNSIYDYYANPKLKHEGHGKIYQVRVTHDPKTFKRLHEPRVFNWPSMEEADDQAQKLMQAGLKTRHCVIHVLEACMHANDKTL